MASDILLKLLQRYSHQNSNTEMESQGLNSTDAPSLGQKYNRKLELCFTLGPVIKSSHLQIYIEFTVNAADASF